MRHLRSQRGARGQERSAVLIDARTIPAGSVLEHDVCIVGAGPAGITLARRLANHGLRIVLVEAGGLRPRVRDQQLFAGRVEGTPYWALDTIRFRALGGSGSRWGGICRPLDPIDLEPRDWMRHSGWPIGYDELARHYPAASAVLGLPDGDFSRPWPNAATTAPGLSGTGFEDRYYRSSPLLDFGEAARASLERATDISVLLNANVTALRAGGPSVRGLNVQTLGGPPFWVQARIYVAAAGAIENARLLLVSGIGNEHDNVGRYFMEHMHVAIGTLRPSAATMRWSSYQPDPPHQPILVSALSPSDELQRRERIGSASITIAPAWYSSRPPFVDWNPRLTVPAERLYRALVRRGGERLARTALDAARTAWNLREGSARARLADGVRTIYYRGEQAPSAENRVTLATARDPLGHPMAHLRWTVGEQDFSNARVVLDRFGAAATRGGWGTVLGPPSDWREQVVGGPHHLGTTRMSADPRTGVVDADGRVHGMDNLYVAGSSVFPTGGHANPTLTVIALAVRLAEHLLEQRRRSYC